MAGVRRAGDRAPKDSEGSTLGAKLQDGGASVMAMQKDSHSWGSKGNAQLK